jgi:hypothetical protein
VPSREKSDSDAFQRAVVRSLQSGLCANNREIRACFTYVGASGGDVSLQLRLAGGEGGIRTPDTLSGMPVFKTGAINHSATSPITTVLLQFARLFQAEGPGMEFHDFGEVGHEVGQAVVAGIRMIFMLHALLLKLFV